MQNNNYEWLLFDADETLFSFDAFAGLKKMFANYHVDFTEQDYSAYQQQNLPLWVQYQNGEITAKQLQEQRFAFWGAKLQVAPSKLNQDFLVAMSEVSKCLPFALEVISQLAKRYKLAVVTNGFTELQQIRLQKTGLAEFFQAVFISEQIGVAKPDVRVFEHIFKQLNITTKETVLMVGDTLTSDIQGGVNAGVDTCWYNPHSHENHTELTPTYEIKSLHELLALMASEHVERDVCETL